MKLIGMLDSPYVRRVAVSLLLMRQPFEHQVLSVFGDYQAFRSVNPAVKAPTLVCDDGTVLMDSSLILQYCEALSPAHSLVPADPGRLVGELRSIGLALAACEKAVQIVYEHNVRPVDKLHRPWLERVTQQMFGAFDALERELRVHRPVVTEDGLTQAGVTAVVVWHFARQLIPGVLAADRCPTLAACSELAERLPAFLAAPHGTGACRA